MKNKSFTLIELLVVIVIIGILAGVIMISTSSSIDKANFAKAQAFSSTIQNELLSNLVSEWTFDEGTTTSGNATNAHVKDTWGANNGILTTGYIPEVLAGNSCVYGKCLGFTNDYITVPNFNNGPEISATVWVKFNSFGGRWIINKRDGAVNDQWQLMNYNNNVTAAIFGGTPAIVRGKAQFLQSKINLNTWNHLTFTTNGILGGYVKIYLNGKLEDTGPLTGNMFLSTWDVKIGKEGWNSGLYFDGSIDDVRLYNTALSSSQIKQNYIAGLNSMLANGNISKEDYNERINNLAYNDSNE
jgi:prepilin-type N-terminal cleavage/methylation domain-containing protein